MSIRFKCPHCKKSLSVKDEFAGRKGSCPACKKGLTIPAPVAAPADLEALAAAAFTDQPQPKPAAQPETRLSFPCPYCEAPIQMDAELAGKQAPCPECRRIIKVPQLVKDEPVDWRKPGAGIGPSGARRDTEPAPEGAWGSTVSTSRASQQGLIEAGVIVEEREPWTTVQKVRWGTAAVVAAGLLIAAFWGGFYLRGQMRQKRALELALQKVASQGGKPRLSADRDAAIHIAAGEFHLHSGRRDCVAKANEHFRTARAFLGQSNTSDRDLLLSELALLQVELGGEGEDVEKGRRLKWDAAQKEIRLTLTAIAAPETRIEALRSVAQELIRRRQQKGVASLAQHVSNPELAPEALAVVGLELLSARENTLAESLADQAAVAYRAPPPPPAKDKAARDPLEIDIGGKEAKQRETDKVKPVPPPAALVALCGALNRQGELKKAAKDFVGGDAWNIGEIEALARKGDLATARARAPKVSPLALSQVRALVAIAAVALEKGDASAAADLESAAALVENERGDVPAGLLLRLIRLGLRAGLADRMDKLARAVKDPDLRAWAQLELFRAELADKKSSIQDTPADMGEKKRLAQALALEALARHTARHEGRSPAVIDTWDEGLRPFGHAGAALGLQDRSR